MPCFTERTVSVDLSVADEGVLLRALKAAGFTSIAGTLRNGITASTRSGARVSIVDGEVSMTGEYIQRAAVTRAAGEVKRAYANEAVRTAAKKYGWQVKSNAKTGQLTLDRKAW